MRQQPYLLTSEAVSEGHPDKLADQISDAILDAFLALDPNARVACETMLSNQFVVIAGEFKTASEETFMAVRDQAEALARQVLRDVGYTDAQSGIDPDTCEVQVRFNHQSSHISQGVDRQDGEIGAGDQGLMFGYATDETPDFMPYPFWLATKLVKRQAELRKTGVLPWLRPDAKSQVTLRYLQGKAIGIEKVVLSTQHAPEIGTEELRQAVIEHIIRPILPPDLDTSMMTVLINPTGRFEIGGPNGDTGLTGRKIVADTYGGACPHGGGAFSGKDPSKVDRSAAYMARYIAKNVVAAGLAERCTVQLAYAIGVAEPMSLFIDLHGTGRVDEAELESNVHQIFRLTPRGIMESLDLKTPIFRNTATYGHFGRDGQCLSWERLDKVDELLVDQISDVQIGRGRTMLRSVTAKVLEHPRTAREYLHWVKGLIAAVKAEPDGLRQIRLRIGLAKNLLEEALPVGLFSSKFFEQSDDVMVALKVGSQGYDATIRDTRTITSGIEFIEVTVASEGEIDYLRMLKLHENGLVSGLGRVTKSGTKKTELIVTVEAEAVSQQAVLAKERRIILEAIDRKANKVYPANTALIIAIDDTMSFDRSENQANIVSALRERVSSLRSFHTVAVVGLVNGLFLCQACDTV